MITEEGGLEVSLEEKTAGIQMSELNVEIKRQRKLFLRIDRIFFRIGILSTDYVTLIENCYKTPLKEE